MQERQEAEQATLCSASASRVMLHDELCFRIGMLAGQGLQPQEMASRLRLAPDVVAGVLAKFAGSGHADPVPIPVDGHTSPLSVPLRPPPPTRFARFPQPASYC